MHLVWLQTRSKDTSYDLMRAGLFVYVDFKLDFIHFGNIGVLKMDKVELSTVWG